MDDFLKEILPTANTVEILLDNQHEANLMSLLAPAVDDSPTMFKWASGLSWDYNGNLADSLEKRVKDAGGDTDGELVITLDWSNTDDLDLHVIPPTGASTIKYDNKSPTGTNGKLDVDMNVSSPLTTSPVENIVFKHKDETAEGIYRVRVHNYTKRDNHIKDQGCTVTIKCAGKVHQLSKSQTIQDGEMIHAATFHYSKKSGITQLETNLDTTTKNRSMWGVDTNRFHKVNMIMDSPNYWGDDAIGNKHLFFIVDNAINDSGARGFYNEYLNSDLRKDRKVFEVLASSMTVPPTDNQLSGVGFSTTLPNVVTLRVNDTTYSVNTKQGLTS